MSMLARNLYRQKYKDAMNMHNYKLAFEALVSYRAYLEGRLDFAGEHNDLYFDEEYRRYNRVFKLVDKFIARHWNVI